MTRESDKSDAENPGVAASDTAELQESFLSPGFRSAAAMAGWDEEALLHASLVVEDTPVRETRSRKGPGRRPSRTTPISTSAKRNRRSRLQSPTSAISPVVLILDDNDESDQTVNKAKIEPPTKLASDADEDKNVETNLPEKASGEALPCMDRLREELSCAICLEICFEPSTTPCGHSFCIKCLKCAAAKCGKRCPKCRQLISNGRSCTVNTVLWNTIQLLFPKDVEARKNAVNEKSHKELTVEGSSTNSSVRTNSRYSIRGATRASQNLERDRTFRSRHGSNQSEDAALALRLQREEFLVLFNSTSEPRRNAVRVNPRAMASGALHTRTRNRTI